LLQRLTGDTDLAAVAVAEEALLQFDPQRILPQVLASLAGGVRLRGVVAFGKIPNLEQLPLVVDRLDDVHPEVRIAACKTLAQLAQQPEYATPIRRLATQWLMKDRWRALEQAAILLSLLDEKTVAPRLVELLRFERPEVFVAAAWGLRKLAVPTTLPDQLREVEHRWQQSPAPDARYKDMVDRELAQLCWSMGQAKYAPAARVLARFIPKNVLTIFGPQSRIAAIWALGLISAKSQSDELVNALIDRLTDESTIFLENMGVRRMCAISLGRLKAEPAVEAVSKYYPKSLSVDPFPNACGWALEQITGEKLPTSGIAKALQRGWFLESVE
jgi:HEAT repeat protein